MPWVSAVDPMDEAPSCVSTDRSGVLGRFLDKELFLACATLSCDVPVEPLLAIWGIDCLSKSVEKRTRGAVSVDGLESDVFALLSTADEVETTIESESDTDLAVSSMLYVVGEVDSPSWTDGLRPSPSSYWDECRLRIPLPLYSGRPSLPAIIALHEEFFLLLESYR
jgi:hypothetical protein